MVSVEGTRAGSRDEVTPKGLQMRIDGAQPISTALAKALEALCEKAETASSAWTVILYVSGAPRDDWTREVDVAVVTKWERALRRLERLSMPTVAVASGDCGGSALDAFLATDSRIGTKDLRLLVPVHGDATWPGMTIYRLTQQAGPARIRRAVLFGAPIDGSQALDLFLLDELVDDPETALVAITERNAAQSGKELAIRRRLMFDATTTSFEDALGSHLAACDRALRRTASGTVL